MAGENPDEEPTGAPDEFQAKTVWQRAKIAASGPLTNILLAFLVMPLVFMIGTYVEGPAKVGYVEKGSPAEKGGLPGRRRHRRDQRQEDQQLDKGAFPHRREP